MNKVLKIGYWTLLGIIVLLIFHFFFFQFSGLENSIAATESMSAEEKGVEITNIANGWNDILFIATAIIGVVTAVIAILFSLYQIIMEAIENKETRKNLFIIIGLGAVIVIVSYFAASASVPFILGLIEGNTVNGIVTDANIIEEWGSTVKAIETGLFITYIIAGLLVVSLFFGEILRIFK